MNEYSITQIAATIDALLDVKCHSGAAQPIQEVLEAAKIHFNGKQCDRVFMYNPDAIALWVYEKYAQKFAQLEQKVQLTSKATTVFPPVTPVCFASMYSGFEPKKHGIQKYAKPVLAVDTAFDDLPRAGRRAAIVSTQGDSISRIFLNRNIDYFIYKTKEECNEKALELIERDEHALIVLYNGDYDHWMHRFGPEGKRPLRALDENIGTFLDVHKAISKAWKSHSTALFFAPDHGCHAKFRLFGTHGINEPCDMQTVHFTSFIPPFT